MAGATFDVLHDDDQTVELREMRAPVEPDDVGVFKPGTRPASLQSERGPGAHSVTEQDHPSAGAAESHHGRAGCPRMLGVQKSKGPTVMQWIWVC